ncbi:MAG: LptF/LptG family permease [Actinomycetota bacterium]
MLIDRYITRAQLNAFIIVFVSLAGLYFVFDAFTNLDEFSAHAAKAGGLAKVLAVYYGYRLIWFFDATSPVISLCRSSHDRANMALANEITGLVASKNQISR